VAEHRAHACGGRRFAPSRLKNATDDVYVMHLHGFYYRIDEFAGPLADVQSRSAQGQTGGDATSDALFGNVDDVVTEPAGTIRCSAWPFAGG
jgi:hypothetical protein